jgi:hypothetical protein
MKRIAFLLWFCAFTGWAQSETPPETSKEYDYAYGAFKLNYGLRPVNREKAMIAIDIDALDNKFGTTIKDSFQLDYMNDLKGFSFGFEVGLDNKLFADFMLDIASRTRGNYNTNLVTLEGNLGYNAKLVTKYDIFLRPSLGVSYSRLNTRFGTYYSNNPFYENIEVKQSSTLVGIRPRIQLELPVAKIDGAGTVFVRFEGGWNASTYLSRFIKLRGQRTVPNSNGNYTYDADRFYLDGEKSNYYINGQHINKPPTNLGGYFLGVELGFKFW